MLLVPVCLPSMLHSPALRAPCASLSSLYVTLSCSPCSLCQSVFPLCDTLLLSVLLVPVCLPSMLHSSALRAPYASLSSFCVTLFCSPCSLCQSVFSLCYTPLLSFLLVPVCLLSMLHSSALRAHCASLSSLYVTLFCSPCFLCQSVFLLCYTLLLSVLLVQVHNYSIHIPSQFKTASIISHHVFFGNLFSKLLHILSSWVALHIMWIELFSAENKYSRLETGPMARCMFYWPKRPLLSIQFVTIALDSFYRLSHPIQQLNRICDS